MNKFQLPKKNENRNSDGKPVRVRLATLEIIKELSKESGLSLPKVLHRMAKYCYRNVEFIDS